MRGKIDLSSKKDRHVLFAAATIDDRNLPLGTRWKRQPPVTSQVTVFGFRTATPYRPVTLIECRLIVGQPDVPFVRERDI
jgi:hypothetical protein